MTSSSIQLSICIPTLNRGSYIGATLDSIASQLTDEVEIVIVDGGSTDNTLEVVAGFQKSISSLRYINRKTTSLDNPVAPSGTGFDRDCSYAVEQAVGRYCWLFTDDDLLKPGAIARVLEATQREYELIIVNAEVRSADLSRLLEVSRLKLAKDRIYQRPEWECFFSDTASYLSFLGGVVIKRAVWKTRNKDPYLGTGFIHFGVVFQRPLAGDALAIAEPLIQIRYGDALYMRTSRYFEIWMFGWPNLIWSFPNISESFKRRVCPKEPWRKKRTLLLFRANGVFSVREYNDWLRTRLRSRRERFIPRLIAGFPGSLLNFFAILHYFLSPALPGQCLADLTKSPFYFARWLRTYSKRSSAFSMANTISPSEHNPIRG